MTTKRITTRATPEGVWFSFDGGSGATLTPDLARQFARRLVLHAVQVEVIGRRGSDAFVGPRESVVE